MFEGPSSWESAMVARLVFFNIEKQERNLPGFDFDTTWWNRSEVLKQK